MADKFVTFLQNAGKVVVSFLKNDLVVADNVAKATEPIVDIAFPGIAPLFNGTVAVVGAMEAAGQLAVANAPTGTTSVQKASLALAAASPLFTSWMQQYNVDPNTTDIGSAINAVVAFLNSLGAPGSLTALTQTLTTQAGASTVTSVKTEAK